MDAIPLSILIKFIPEVIFDLQDNPEKTAATTRGNFYITGDRGVMDGDGYFWFVGRADDVIISSGLVYLPLLESRSLPGEILYLGGVVIKDFFSSSRYRIGPFEVESALIEHPAVVESAVVSSPDSIRGEVE